MATCPDTPALPAAAACLAARGAVRLVDGGEARAAVALLADAAAVLRGPAGREWLRGIDVLARAEAAALATAAAAAIATPPESTFAGAGGDLLAAPADGGAADAWAERVAACLALASTLAAGVARPGDAEATAAARAPHRPPPAVPATRLATGAGLWSVGDGTGGEAAAAAGLPTSSAPKSLVIEVIGGEDASDGEEEEEQEEKDKAAAEAAETAAACGAADAAVAALLAVALYCGGAGSDAALPLDGAWAAPACAAAARAALEPATSPPLLPLTLRPLRRTLIQAHWTGLDAVKMAAYEGPGVYERALAGRQLAALVGGAAGCGGGPAAALAAGALPVVLAAADDPAPPVQRGGLAALAALAAACPPSALGGDRGILLPAAKKAVVGCDERAWPAAAGAAVGVAVALDAAAGGGGGGGGARSAPPPTTTTTTTLGRPTTAFVPPPPAACLALLPDFLSEGERHAHERGRSLAWLAHAPRLLAGCGGGCLAVAPRLFPLLLRWLAAPDGGVRESAALALAVLLRATWPRAAPHAAHVWAHLAAARAGRPGFEPSSAEVEALVECAAVLWAAGGEGFREAVLVEARGGGGAPGGRALVAALGVR